MKVQENKKSKYQIFVQSEDNNLDNY